MVTGPNAAHVKAGHDGRRNGTSEPNLANPALVEKLGGWPLTLLVAEGEQAGLRLSSRRAGRLSSPPGGHILSRHYRTPSIDETA